MEDKNPISSSPPRKRAATNSSKIPSPIEMSNASPKNDYQQKRDKQEKDSKNSSHGVVMENDKSSTLDETHSSVEESERISSLVQSSNSSPKAEDAASENAIVVGNEQRSQIEGSIDRLRIQNDQLMRENEDLRRLVEALRQQQGQTK